jgi:predicted nucleic acid-binding protein
MTIVDANLLLYAYNADAPQQAAAAQWLAKLLESGEIAALPWVTVSAPILESGPIRSRPRKRLQSLLNGRHNLVSSRCSPDHVMVRFWKDWFASTAQPVRW